MSMAAGPAAGAPFARPDGPVPRGRRVGHVVDR
ncbi:hypothetical protein BPA30113_03797 [Burkholderia paludis]|uniref:Uncharacterized protein n=1 Tax=Burkholderia paludis TaxID=1506587 RepID=A0A6J5ECM9_9BURK|nr:hypothetical protein LMG30113_04672 [Burkholderia paludis]VWB82572.1 hypothetical protein BPA30113_03797 [Burkholderia paludis]